MPAWDLIDHRPLSRAWLAHHGYFSLNHGLEPRLSIQMQLVRKADLRQQLSRSIRRFRCRGDAASKTAVRAGPYLVCGRYLRSVGPLDGRVRGRCRATGAQIPFKMQSRCDLMTRETVADLKRAGCCEVWMGAESGSQRILDAMEKGIQVQQIYQARENLRRHEIRAGLFLQFGYPGETGRTSKPTIRMVRTTRSRTTSAFRCPIRCPAPSFISLSPREIGKKTNWTESGDLAMMFRGAFSTELYRALARRDASGSSKSTKAAALIASAWAEVDALKTGRTVRSGGCVMKLLLTHAYFLFEDPKEQQIMKPYAPLGLLYLSSHLRKQGFSRRNLRLHFRIQERIVRSSRAAAHQRRSAFTPI